MLSFAVFSAVSGTFAVLAPAAMAQDVLMPPPPVSTTPPAVQEHEDSNPMRVFAPVRNPQATEAVSQPFQWGSVVMHPHLDYQFLYGNGINASPGQQQDTVVQQLSPGVLFNLGDHWTLDYTPTLNFYSSRAFRDTLDHSVQLGWGTAYGDWFLSGAQSCALTADPNIATAAQTDQQNYSTAFNASYLINSKLSLDLGVNQSFNYIGSAQSSTNGFQNLTDYRSWSTMNWLNYQFWPRLNVGVGLGAGYVNVGAGPDSVNEQYLGRVNWRATDKVSFSLNGGLEDWQYLSGGAGDLVTPIFGGSIQYQPFEQTRLTVGASRSVSTSYFINQTTEDTGVSADLNQRLLGRLYLDLSGAYSHTKYVSSAAASGQIGYGTGRSEDYYLFGARLSCPFLKRGSFSVFFQYSENSSTQTGFLNFYQYTFTSQSAYSFSSRQVGFSVSYRY